MNNIYDKRAGTRVPERAAWTMPSVRERGEYGGYEQFGIFDRLLKDRIVFLDNQIDDMNADIVVAQLLYLESQDPEKDVNLYINTPGGSVTSGLAIYDAMQYIKPDVVTICIGQAASMGAILLAAGSPGKRYTLPSSRVLIHQPWGGVQGQASDISIQAKEMVRLKKLLVSYFAHHTGKDEATVEKDMERDRFMSANDAVEYGVVDQVFTRDNNEQGEK